MPTKNQHVLETVLVVFEDNEKCYNIELKYLGKYQQTNMARKYHKYYLQ